MNPALKNLIQKLTDLDKKAQEIDESLKDVRVEINDVFWDLMELKNEKKSQKRLVCV